MTKLAQVAVQAHLNESFRTDLNLFDGYLGRRVVIEEEHIGVPVSVAVLKANGAGFVELGDYTQYDDHLHDVARHAWNHKKGLSFNKSRPTMSLSSRILAKSHVASIQLLDDVLQGVNSEDIFKI